MFVKINILKILQWLQASTEKGYGKQMLLNCREIYKSDRNPFKMLKAHFLVTLQADGPQSATLSVNELHYKYF